MRLEAAMKVVASMITRNECGRYLPYTVPAILEAADWLIVLDDGSEDDTVEVLESFDRVSVTRNRGSVWDARGEGVLRDHLLRLTFRYQPTPNWVISIDADELIADPGTLRAVLAKYAYREEPLAVSMRMVEVWGRSRNSGPRCIFDENAAVPKPDFETYEEAQGWSIRTDGGWAPRQCPVIWRPPKHAHAYTYEMRWRAAWTIPELKVACGREPEIVRVEDYVESGIDLLHLGWSNPDERQARYDRYMAIDGGRFHNDAHLRSILEEPTLEPYPRPRTWRT